jgi:hypothetical protein
MFSWPSFGVPDGLHHRWLRPPPAIGSSAGDGQDPLGSQWHRHRARAGARLVSVPVRPGPAHSFPMKGSGRTL